MSEDTEFTFEDAVALNPRLKRNKPSLQLTGEDGNAFFILGRADMALVRAGYSKEERERFNEQATSGDYDHLLQTVMRWFDVS